MKNFIILLSVILFSGAANATIMSGDKPFWCQESNIENESCKITDSRGDGNFILVTMKPSKGQCRNSRIGLINRSNQSAFTIRYGNDHCGVNAAAKFSPESNMIIDIYDTDVNFIFYRVSLK